MHWTILLMLLSTVQKQNKQWEEFKVTYNKVYDNFDEEIERKQYFLKNLDKIEMHNERYKQGLESYKLELNELSDQNLKEIQQEFTVGSGLQYSLESVNLAIQDLEEETKNIQLNRIWKEFKVCVLQCYFFLSYKIQNKYVLFY